MRILALDLATATGWATNQFGRIDSGVQHFDVRRGESPGMRWIKFNAWLRNWDNHRWTNEKIDLIIYEQNFLRGGAPTEIAMGFSTRVHEFVAQQVNLGFKMEHTNVSASDLKKFTCGFSGKKADKAAMYQAAVKRGWLNNTGPTATLVVDDNEVDARCLLQWALSEFKLGK
jgi:hypothetical protein